MCNRSLLAMAAASTALLLSNHAHAGALDVTAPATMQVFAAAMPASAKVYPPLPTLAILPPTVGGDEAPVGKSSSKKARCIVDCRCSAPEPRLVVSDESRAYLKDVESRLAAALAR
ncbi:putative signal peptide protein [Candidatus Paraburkholderia calva]|nr:putative signal peptide protein [Candidatus Paraburkholderia calva]